MIAPSRTPNSALKNLGQPPLSLLPILRSPPPLNTDRQAQRGGGDSLIQISGLLLSYVRGEMLARVVVHTSIQLARIHTLLGAVPQVGGGNQRVIPQKWIKLLLICGKAGTKSGEV